MRLCALWISVSVFDKLKKPKKPKNEKEEKISISRPLLSSGKRRKSFGSGNRYRIESQWTCRILFSRRRSRYGILIKSSPHILWLELKQQRRLRRLDALDATLFPRISTLKFSINSIIDRQYSRVTHPCVAVADDGREKDEMNKSNEVKYLLNHKF